MDRVFLVIDPLIGFCDEEGSLCQVFGVDELEPIQNAIGSLGRLDVLSGPSFTKVLVRSEYQSGQFTQGDLTHDLANLCVRGKNFDCDLSSLIADIEFDRTFVKNSHSALDSPEFCRWVDSMLDCGITEFLLAGVLLEHCVKETAKDLARYVRDRSVKIHIISNFVGSRKSKYDGGSASIVSQTLSELSCDGISISNISHFTV